MKPNNWGDEPYSNSVRESFDDLPLFRQSITAPHNRQSAELERVRGKTADLIEQFFMCYQVGETFHAGDLHKFVSARAPIAPASADRVMRAMRRAGQVAYEVIDRSQSLYRKCTG